jgi:hypothetical protein
MERKAFHLSGDSIVRVRGLLANGQHRLAAVVKTGITCSFLVLESEDEELYKYIDAGMKRKAADALIGVPYATSLPAIAKWVITYDRGIASDPSKASVMSQPEMIDYCIENQELLEEAAGFATALYDSTRLLPISIAGGIFIIGCERGWRDEVTEFLDEVFNGADRRTSASDLRNRLILNKGAKAKLRPNMMFGLTLKSLRSYLNGTRPGILRWDPDEGLPLLQ